MRSFRLTATLIDPLTQRKSRQSQTSEGLNTIRGTTVRGALARAYLDEVVAPDDRFRALFLDERQVRFGSLQPWDQVLPLTGTSCKRVPGFGGDMRTGHGVVDLLWLRGAEKLSGGPLSSDAANFAAYCQHRFADNHVCGAALKPFSGGWTGIVDGQSPDAVSGPSTTVNMHVGIDRATSTASPSIFYALQAIEPSMDTWSGTVQASDQGWAKLSEVLEMIDYRIRVGHARTRGYGRVQLQIAELPPPDRQNLAAAWQTWSDEHHSFLTRLNPPDAPVANSEVTYFAIGFPTGAVIVDRFLRYSLDPGEAVDWLPPLAKPTAIPQWQTVDGDSSFQMLNITAVTRHELVRGWQAAHGLPKSDEYAIAPGAVYLYAYQGDSDWLWNQLIQLQHDGLGLRRNEGFGAVTISDPFHQLFSLPPD